MNQFRHGHHAYESFNLNPGRNLPFGKHVYFWRGTALQIIGRWPTFLSQERCWKRKCWQTQPSMSISKPSTNRFLLGSWNGVRGIYNLGGGFNQNTVALLIHTELKCDAELGIVELLDVPAWSFWGCFSWSHNVDFPKKTLEFLLGTNLGWSFFFGDFRGIGTTWKNKVGICVV